MARPVRTLIDETLCIGCGLCVKVCPDDTLSLVKGKAKVTGSESLQCGQCAAVCPEGAIRVESLDPTYPALSSIKPAEKPCDAPGLVELMLTRRSCRHYLTRPVDLPILKDLVTIGSSAPSGTNSQAWSFTILADRTQVLQLGHAVGNFFKRLNRLADSRLLRVATRLIGKPELSSYHEEYQPRVERSLREFEDQGKDRLFHGAPTAILISTRPGAASPTEDATLAAGQIILAAQAMGMGSCLVGFVVEAMHNDKRIGRMLGLDAKERVRAVIALGHPAIRYQRPAGRFAPPLRILKGEPHDKD